MPDWSYQTLFRPLLFQLPARIARSLTLSAMGALSRLPGGALVIRTLGHMEPSPLLQSELAQITLATPVGLSGSLDPSGTGHKALAQFGFGFMELGPVTVNSVKTDVPIQFDAEKEKIVYPSYLENDGLESAVSKIANSGHSLPQFARVTPLPNSTPEQAQIELSQMVKQLRNAGAAGFYIDVLQHSYSHKDIANLLTDISELINTQPAFIYVPSQISKQELQSLLELIDLEKWTGIVIGESLRNNGDLILQKEDKHVCLELLNVINYYETKNWVIKIACGIHEPQDAIELIEGGADYLLLHSGLVFAGPGLPKRVNEAILHQRVQQTLPPKPASFWSHWGWMCLLGLGMIIGGILAWIVATATVLLPYDESFLGLTVDDIAAWNHRVYHFMSHDRITLAGTMISIGILYFQLGRHGLRYGLHWAKTAVIVSGVVGFSSFFLYLGYGYFDPLHALAAAILLPMFLLSMRNNPDAPFRKPVNLRNDRIWKLAMWGQLCFVVLGFALLIGGLTITAVGVTHVFVPEDLKFIGLTTEQIRQFDPKLIPLIAHDRAGFGGALFSDALAICVIALWGIQQGERWIWWTLLVGGAPAFFAAFFVHVHIGYKDLWHLAPAIFALLLYLAGLILLYPYLTRKFKSAKLDSLLSDQNA